jgi:hypothetical protein
MREQHNMIEIIETIVVKIGTEELRFQVPGGVNFVRLSRDVTKAGDLGRDIKYIVKNRELDVKGEGSTELRARKEFQEDFKKLCYWCMLGKETVSKSIQKSKLYPFLDR